jgi:uncharacterized protein (DUF2141 family)
MGGAVSRRARAAGDLARPRLSHALIAVGLLLVAPARAATLEVTVTNVRSPQGHVRVAICTQDDFLTPKCRIRQGVPAQEGATVLRFENVPPGEYAAQAYSDEHDWGEVRRDLLGFPENGIGFSNDAPMRFGPPKWQDARFSVGEAPVRVVIPLHYYGL